MRLLGSFSLLAVLLTACSHALASATQYPTPVPSAAQPAAEGRGDVGYARRAMEAIRAALREYDPGEALEHIPEQGLHLPEAGVEAVCAAAPGSLPILACHLGPSAGQPVAQALFWYERGAWQSQLYPQAPARMAGERRAFLADLGCQIGCYSGVVRARQYTPPDEEQPELLVVVNLGATEGQQAEEVHLLRMTDGEWQTVWTPGGGDWNYGHARVELPARGIAHFKVRSSSWLRSDSLAGYFAEPEQGAHRRFTERWVRKGSAYMLVDRREEPTPYSTLVRLVHYLSTGADRKAAALLEPSLPLEDVRKALAQKPLRQGWGLTVWKEHGFLVDRTGNGQPGLGVRFVHQAGEWLLAELWATNP
jgi:hypothetical protein